MEGNPTASDEDLVRRLQAGDDAAFAALMGRFGPLLARHADRQLPAALRRRISVSDVVQEAAVVAYRRCGDFDDRGDGSFRNWLLRIVDLKVREAVRANAGTSKRALGREAHGEGAPDPAAMAGSLPSPSQVAVGAELAEIARAAFESLEPQYQRVFRLARHEGLPLREVAVRMGRSREAVKKLYARALAEFTAVFDRLRGATHG